VSNPPPDWRNRADFSNGPGTISAIWTSPTSRSLSALLVGLVGGWAFEYGGVSPFQGPIARATEGLDCSWLASIVFGGLGY